MFGISIGISESNIIVGNTISNSTSQGIVLWDSPNNAIYHNNFVNNTLHFYDTGATPSLNAWDDGEEGNFWSDYNGTDANSDGIGDTPYRVDSNNQDGYPLMKRWDPAKPVDNAPPQISISSPENKLYNVSSVPLTFSANEAASRISFSLDNQDNVTITGNTTLSGLPNGSHNLTVYVTDQFGNTGASEIIYFSVDVPEPFPTLLVASASGVSITAVAACLLYYRKKRNH